MSQRPDDRLQRPTLRPPLHPSWRLRALLFLYGNGNIAGCALALLGPGLLFAGVIGSGWWAITAALYAAGWLAAPRPPVQLNTLAQTLGADETLARLDELLRQAAPHLSADMRQRLDGIRASVAEVLPRLVEAQADSGAHSADLYTVRETVLHYLPETLGNYVALPPAFRASHALQDGKTARTLLLEQLDLLDRTLKDVLANVAAHDANALLANGRFLEARFKQADFGLG